jgi:hypothetical protein
MDNTQSPISKQEYHKQFLFGDPVIDYWILIGDWCLVIGYSGS